jgi:NADH:ubiquinone oxidoreductase subunit 5 (subunit L)/multisubunit Na+/H+ antiporter MnhA subunit
VIDGAIVNGSWKLVGCIAGLVRRLQSGYLYHYALVMILRRVCADDVFRVAQQVGEQEKWVC